ncbi:hypothetical protein M0208_12570 [Sphingomonas sp. SUN019]|nr:hypothetical protein [Sphingomonas sp. SUN019]UVO51302.1 hypothetical protein M0208_12570 [Sphingomonas sp. SUN019]
MNADVRGDFGGAPEKRPRRQAQRYGVCADMGLIPLADLMDDCEFLD